LADFEAVTSSRNFTTQPVQGCKIAIHFCGFGWIWLVKKNPKNNQFKGPILSMKNLEFYDF
jgi:hypothetical protein